MGSSSSFQACLLRGRQLNLAANRRVSGRCLVPARLQWYLRRNYYNPVGLKHVPPTGELYEQDWSGGWPSLG